MNLNDSLQTRYINLYVEDKNKEKLKVLKAREDYLKRELRAVRCKITTIKKEIK